MIYCIGRTDRYEAALGQPSPPVKKGGDAGYAGGWVWATVADARRFIAMNGLDATHSVYGLRAEWDRDTIAVTGESWRRLARDAEVVHVASDRKSAEG